MQDSNDDGGDQRALSERLHGIVDRMLEPFGTSSPRGMQTLLYTPPPFDYSRPNEHDSKAKFLLEKGAVEEGFQLVHRLVGILTANDNDAERLEMLERLKTVVDLKLYRSAPRSPVPDTFSMVRKNVADAGGYASTVWVLLDLWAVLGERKGELNSQEEKFWKIKHRAPDYYARAIALRLAKLFARETRQRPTFGTSGETGDPSTSFTRALADVFEVLGIATAVRSPAEWAIAQITEEDLGPPKNTLGAMIGASEPPRQTETMHRIVQALLKKGGSS